MWPEDREDIYQTTPELLFFFLRKHGFTQEDAARSSGLGFRTFIRILGADGGRRPKLSELETITRSLKLSPREHTALLASADYYPDQQQILYLLNQWIPRLDSMASPIQVMDLRGFVWGGNVAWQRWFGAPPPLAPSAATANYDAAFQAERIKLTLPGTHWLLLVFHPASRLFQYTRQVSEANWRQFATEQLLRFRVATQRLGIHSPLPSGAKPSDEQWWPELAATLERLLGESGDFYRTAWRQTEYQQGRQLLGIQPPVVTPASSERSDQVELRPSIQENYSQVRLALDGVQKTVGLTARTIKEDARFYCVEWSPIDMPFAED